MSTPTPPVPEHHPAATPHDPNDGERGSGIEDGSSAEITAHAAHLRRLSRRIDQLDGDVAQLRTDTDELATIAAVIQRTLDEQQHANREDGPPCWATMTADQAAEAWEVLADWIEQVLVPWYDITRDQLPDCWALHPPVLVELSWLQHTHHAAYKPDAPAHLVADWHTHFKPATLRAIRDVIPRRGHRTCTPGHHLATDTQRAPHSTGNVPPPVIAQVPYTPPTEQPALRQHWHTFYQQAVATDLAIREHRGTAGSTPMADSVPTVTRSPWPPVGVTPGRDG
jgi:hypothetical protein